MRWPGPEDRCLLGGVLDEGRAGQGRAARRTLGQGPPVARQRPYRAGPATVPLYVPISTGSRLCARLQRAGEPEPLGRSYTVAGLSPVAGSLCTLSTVQRASCASREALSHGRRPVAHGHRGRGSAEPGCAHAVICALVEWFGWRSGYMPRVLGYRLWALGCRLWTFACCFRGFLAVACTILCYFLCCAARLNEIKYLVSIDSRVAE